MTPIGNGRSWAHSAIACWFTVTNLPLNSARAAFWSSTVRDEPVIALALGVRAG
jgi:surface antigen